MGGETVTDTVPVTSLPTTVPPTALALDATPASGRSTTAIARRSRTPKRAAARGIPHPSMRIPVISVSPSLPPHVAGLPTSCLLLSELLTAKVGDDRLTRCIESPGFGTTCFLKPIANFVPTQPSGQRVAAHATKTMLVLPASRSVQVEFF